MSKNNDYALETLTQEHDLLIEKIGVKKSEMKFYNQASDEELEAWEVYVRDLKAGIARLRGEKGGNGRRPPKQLAKCNNGKSQSWCYSACPKNKDKSCSIIKFYKKEKTAAASN